MLRANHHVLYNLLNQIQLINMETKKSVDLDNDTID